MIESNKPVTLYFFITFILFIGLVLAGLLLKDFIGSKLAGVFSKKQAATSSDYEADETKVSRAIFRLAGLVIAVLALIFLAYTFALRGQKRVY